MSNLTSRTTLLAALACLAACRTDTGAEHDDTAETSLTQPRPAPRAAPIADASDQDSGPRAATDAGQKDVTTTPPVDKAASPAIAHAPVPQKIALIGMDGADYKVFAPILEAGRMPHMQALIKSGSLHVIRSHPPTRSPAVWTTIAVGATKEKHGIYDYVTNSYYWPKDIRTKKKNLTLSSQRKLPAIWTEMTRAGRSSVVVGWLSTWPAEDIKGAMVAPFIDIGNRRQTTIKGSIYKTGAERQTFDPQLFAELKPLLKNPAAYGPQARKKYYDEPPEGDPIYKQIKILKRYNYTASWTEARMHNVTASTIYTFKKYDPDLVMAYYQCPDSFGHRLWHFRLSEQALAERLKLLGADPARAADLKRRYGQAIDNCYAAIDEQVGRLMQTLGPEFSVIIMSDHGFGEYNFPKVNKNVPFDGGHRDEGLVLFSGPAFKQDAQVKDVWTEDIAPTAMRVLGLPIPDYVEGRVVEEALR